jgi:hypothetical protein
LYWPRAASLQCHLGHCPCCRGYGCTPCLFSSAQPNGELPVKPQRRHCPFCRLCISCLCRYAVPAGRQCAPTFSLVGASGRSSMARSRPRARGARRRRQALAPAACQATSCSPCLFSSAQPNGELPVKPQRRHEAASGSSGRWLRLDRLTCHGGKPMAGTWRPFTVGLRCERPVPAAPLLVCASTSI